MIRGTTPTHTFELPFDTAEIKEIKVIYAQDNEPLFCKRMDDCDVDGSNVSVKLTQEETFLFDHKKMVQIQIRVLTFGEDSLITAVMKVPVDKCLDDEVLS